VGLLEKLKFWGTRDDEELISKDKATSSYFIILSLSAVIATLGILSDNDAVIIGAMLLAPLMRPISSLSVSISRGRLPNILSALSHLSLSIAVVIGLGLVLSRLIPFVGVPEAALVRAQPTFTDLLIALAAGAAGMYAYLHKDVSEGLAGVAVAVSLQPPLTVIGIGLATANWSLAIGSTVLFFTNVVAILSAELLILFYHGRNARRSGEKEVARAGWGITLIFALVLAVLLGGALFQTFQEEKLRDTVQRTLQRELSGSEAELSSFTLSRENEKVRVRAVLRVPETAAPPDTSRLNTSLVYELEQSVQLEISLLRTQAVTRELSEQEQQEIQQVKQELTIDSISPELLRQIASEAAKVASPSGE